MHKGKGRSRLEYSRGLGEHLSPRDYLGETFIAPMKPTRHVSGTAESIRARLPKHQTRRGGEDGGAESSSQPGVVWCCRRTGFDGIGRMNGSAMRGRPEQSPSLGLLLTWSLKTGRAARREERAGAADGGPARHWASQASTIN